VSAGKDTRDDVHGLEREAGCQPWFTGWGRSLRGAAPEEEVPVNCPVDGTTLNMTERQGVEIDYCPSCRGVWLDRGELDKIIERSNENEDRDWVSTRAPEHHDRDWNERGEHRHGKKKRSFLSEMFEFGD
jgi:Zn-finger nucleic acid-binding protein